MTTTIITVLLLSMLVISINSQIDNDCNETQPCAHCEVVFNDLEADNIQSAEDLIVSGWAACVCVDKFSSLFRSISK